MSCFVCRRSSLDMRYKASDTSDAANKALLNVDEKYFNKCRRKMLSCCCYFSLLLPSYRNCMSPL